MKQLRKIDDFRHFGSKLMAYDNDKWYLFITNDRDGKSYFIVDKKILYFYPINSLIKKYGIIDDNDFSKLATVDLSILGKSICPNYVKKYFDEVLKLNIYK